MAFYTPVGGPVITHGIQVKDAVVAKYGEAAVREVQRAIFKLGQDTRDMARRLAPVDTGALRASIYVSGPGTPLQQSAGYFRAVKAASRRNLRLHNSQVSEFIANERTQTRRSDYLNELREQNDAGIPAYDNLPFHEMLRGGANIFYVAVGAAAYYAAWVENGSAGPKGHPPRPFMSPALDWAEKELPKRMKGAFDAAGSTIRR